MTNEQVKADIAANLPDNTSGAITPAKLRTELGTMADYSDTSSAAAVAGHDAIYHRQQSIPSGDSVTGLGDSLTAGVGASDEAHRWLNLLAGMLGRSTIRNLANSGDQVADTIHHCHATTLSVGDIVSVLIGTNDANLHGLTILPEYLRSLLGLLIYLSRGTELKVVSTADTGAPSGVTESAGWGSNVAMSGVRYTYASGSWLEFTPTTTTVYFGYVLFTGDSATVSVQSGGRTVFSGELVGQSTTFHSNPYGLQGLRLTGVTPGTPLRITITNCATATYGFFWKYVGQSPDPTEDRQMVLCGLVPPTQSSASVQYAFAKAQLGLVRELFLDGYNVRPVNTHWSLAPAHFADNLHTNDSGNAVIAQQQYHAATRLN